MRTSLVTIFEEREVSAHTLTELLQDSRWLTPHEEVKSVTQRKSVHQGLTSVIYHLDVTFSGPTERLLPKQLLMKMSKPRFYEICRKEALFYQQQAQETADLPLAQCFAIAESEEQQLCCLLLEDLTHSHQQTMWPVPPNRAQFRSIVRSLAQLHKNWWASSSIRSPENEIGYPGDLGPSIDFLIGAYKNFCNDFGDLISKKRRQVFELALSQIDTLINDRASADRLTRIHGDAHAWNFLVAEPLHRPILIDWQSWRADLAAHDLAYMIALHLYPDHRRSDELTLLRTYGQEIESSGIAYGFDDLFHDYRVCVIRHLFTPASMHARKLPPVIWYPHMERCFAAFEDLDGYELL